MKTESNLKTLTSVGRAHWFSSEDEDENNDFKGGVRSPGFHEHRDNYLDSIQRKIERLQLDRKESLPRRKSFDSLSSADTFLASPTVVSSRTPAKKTANHHSRFTKSITRNIAPPRSTSHPTDLFSLPPSIIIKATRSLTSTNDIHELTYAIGDYFFVIDVKEDSEWFEVVDPVQRRRGVCLKADFVLVKGSTSISAATEAPDIHYNEAGGSPVVCLARKRVLLSRNVASVDVLTVTLDEGAKKWAFKVCLRLVDGSQRVLVRTFSEFWGMQIHLIAAFPEDAGHGNGPRTLPFLPMHARMDQDRAQERKRVLALYLDRLLFDCRDEIVDSPLLDAFFVPRLGQGDVETSLPLVWPGDSSTALLDLIMEIESPEAHEVFVSFVLGESHHFWTSKSNITYQELREEIEKELDFDFEDILYKDEAGQMIILHGDQDVALLFTAVLDKVTLYCS